MKRRKNLRESLRLMLVAGSREAAPKSVAELAEAAFDGGATAFQLREKTLSGRDLYEEARALQELCARRGKLFIVNDRLDIALAADADALHLGPRDLPLAEAARLWPRRKILGASVNNPHEAEAALEAGADYLGVGALFPTGTKGDARPLDRAALKSIVALGAPMVVIGGINLENAAEAWATGADGLAVISALAGADDPAEAAAKLISRSLR